MHPAENWYHRTRSPGRGSDPRAGGNSGFGGLAGHASLPGSWQRCNGPDRCWRGPLGYGFHVCAANRLAFTTQLNIVAILPVKEATN